MKTLRIILLVHWDLVPPADLSGEKDPRYAKYETEFDVKQALISLGHDVKVIGIHDDLTTLRETAEQWKPHAAFNLLEEFAGNSRFDYYVASYLEMIALPYTGCNPKGLMLAKDKALSKKLLSFHHIHVPDFEVFYKDQPHKRLRKLPYPMIVKSLTEEGSVGIAQASYVENEQQLRERVEIIHRTTQSHAIAEQYISGRELYITVLGNKRLQVLPFRELIFKKVQQDMPRMATYKVKWDKNYRDRWGIEYRFALPLANGLLEKITQLCKRTYRILAMNGYARIDLRLTDNGKLYVLEANPNPGIARDEDCSHAAIKSGLTYEQFIQRLINLALAAGSR